MEIKLGDIFIIEGVRCFVQGIEHGYHLNEIPENDYLLKPIDPSESIEDQPPGDAAWIIESELTGYKKEQNNEN